MSAFWSTRGRLPGWCYSTVSAYRPSSGAAVREPGPVRRRGRYASDPTPQRHGAGRCRPRGLRRCGHLDACAHHRLLRRPTGCGLGPRANPVDPSMHDPGGQILWRAQPFRRRCPMTHGARQGDRAGQPFPRRRRCLGQHDPAVQTFRRQCRPGRAVRYLHGSRRVPDRRQSGSAGDAQQRPCGRRRPARLARRAGSWPATTRPARVPGRRAARR